jgi:hypothetical protein
MHREGYTDLPGRRAGAPGPHARRDRKVNGRRSPHTSLPKAWSGDQCARATDHTERRRND